MVPCLTKETQNMIHLLAALICGLISLLYFSLSIECLCKLSPRFKKWWEK